LSRIEATQAFRLGQRQAADSVDLLGNYDFTRLQVRDHPQQLGAVGASARCLLAVDPGYVEAGRLGALHDSRLAGQVLFLGAHAEIDAGNLHTVPPMVILGKGKMAHYCTPRQKGQPAA